MPGAITTMDTARMTAQNGASNDPGCCGRQALPQPRESPMV